MHRPLPAIRATVMLWGVVAPALAAQWLAATTTRALTVADSLLRDGLPIVPTPSAALYDDNGHRQPQVY